MASEEQRQVRILVYSYSSTDGMCCRVWAVRLWQHVFMHPCSLGDVLVTLGSTRGAFSPKYLVREATLEALNKLSVDYVACEVCRCRHLRLNYYA